MAIAVWNGSAYVPAAPSRFEGGQTPNEAAIWDGTRYVTVWRRVTLAAQGLAKSGTFSVPAANTWTKITGWTPTGSGVLVADSLQVVGAGAATVAASVNYTYGNGTKQARILRNGVVIGTSTAATSDPAVSVQVALEDGDLLTVETRTDASSSFYRGITAADTTLTVTPQG